MTHYWHNHHDPYHYADGHGHASDALFPIIFGVILFLFIVILLASSWYYTYPDSVVSASSTTGYTVVHHIQSRTCKPGSINRVEGCSEHDQCQGGALSRSFRDRANFDQKQGINSSMVDGSKTMPNVARGQIIGDHFSPGNQHADHGVQLSPADMMKKMSVLDTRNFFGGGSPA